MSTAILSDAAVTSSQIAGPVLVDGGNLYAVTVDNYDSAGNQLTRAAKIHVSKSGDNGVTWGEQNPANAPSVFATTAAVYGSPPIPPFLIIDTKVYFPVYPGYTGPQVLPWPMAEGDIGAGDTDSGNDTLTINLLESGFLILTATVVVDGIFGDPSNQNSISAPLAAALNAQLVGLGISPSDMKIGVGPESIPFTYTGFSESVDDSNMIVLTSHTGSAWQLSVTGNMLSPFVPPRAGIAILHSLGTFEEITIFTVTGVDAALNPLYLLFNQYGATLSNHVISVAFVGPGSVLMVAQYSTLTDTWLPTITGGPALTMIPFDSGLGANVACTLIVEIKVRSTGDIVIAYAIGNSAADSTADTYYTYWVVYSTGSWGTPALITSSYVNSPVGSVLDGSNNTIFFIGGLTWSSGTNLYVQTFIVKANNSTVALAAVDPTNSKANITVGLRDAPQTKPQPVQAVIVGTHLVIAITYGSTPSHGVQMLEISVTSLLSGGSWTIFTTPIYAAGVNEWFGAQSVAFWANQYRVLLCQTGSGSFSGTDGNGVLALGTGNATGGGVDSSWGAAVAAVTLNNLPAIATEGASTIPYSISAVGFASGGLLGLLYTFYGFIASTTAGIAPYYFTRFAVLGTLSASCNTPPSGVVGGPYAHTFTSSGGVLPVSWSVSSGSLPTGLTLNPASGILSGIPTAAATYSFSLLVTDSDGNTVTISCSIKISASFTAACNATNSTVGSSYTQTLTVVGGTSPYTWALVMGALPAGTTLNSSTGVISGTLTTPGRYYYTVEVTDATGNIAFVSCSQQTCPAS